MDVVNPLGRKLPALLLCCGLFAACNTSSPTPSGTVQSDSACAGSAIPNKYMVRWKDGTRSIEYSPSEALLSQNLILPNQDAIDFVEQDHKVQIQGGPSKGAVTTLSNATPDVWGQEQTNAPDAWTLATGSGVMVAVIDTGIALNHPQLQSQLSINAGETGTDANGHDKSSNGLDDDGNGYVDDVNGYDFRLKSAAVVDSANATHHGTHVSGIILANHVSTSPSIEGMAPDAKLLALSFLDETGSGDVSNAITAMEYAAQRGAKIINASWGGPCGSANLQLAIAKLESQGVMFVAAAGNGDSHGIGVNLDSQPSYPAAYDAAGQITVGAIDALEYMTSFSNYSTHLVHLMAPGAAIWSTVFDPGLASGGVNHGYEMMDGTSMATPFVSGAAAVVWSYRPKATVEQVKAALLASVNKNSYPVTSTGSLDLRAALDAIASTVSP